MGYFLRTGNTILVGRPSPTSANYLYITNTSCIMLRHGLNAPDVSVQYSFDKSTWNNLQYGIPVYFTNTTDVCYLKGNNSTFASGNTDATSNSILSNDGMSEYGFTLGGDITTLLNEVGEVMNLSTYGDYTFSCLFKGSGVNDISNLSLPSTTLKNRCYQYLFQNCLGLQYANSLSLPSLTLAPLCYGGMFQGCSALIKGPELPATSITEERCYNYMFMSCKRLEEIKVHLTSWSNVGNNFLGSSAGLLVDTPIFKCPVELGTNETIQRGNNYCPTRWTVVNF